ncbi:protein of unknown function [Azospirillum baldaniorum]|uniref:Uncharacterized protein n=1 Tax=Azospirillum baldaniorum TaxID=1064539 RepID=A0A9P1JP91_9PROT|nr:protein of unknown function [Azospirillum baldaniorum]
MRGTDDVKGTSLHLVEHAAQIVADDPQRDELDATHEQHRGQQRFIAGHVDAVDQGAQQAQQDVDEGEAGDRHAHQTPHPQREGGEGGQPVEGQAEQLQEAPFGVAAGALPLLVGNAGLTEADPGEDALHEARAFGHAVDDVDHPAVHQPEVADLARQLDLRQVVEDPVEGAGERPVLQALPHPRVAHGDDHVVALAPFGEELRQQLRRVLQVGVHRHHGVAGGVAQAGRQGQFLAEVARQVDHLDPRVGVVDVQQAVERVVAAAVVDADHLPLGVQPVEHGHQPLEQRRDVGAFVVEGDHHRQAPPLRAGGARRLRGGSGVTGDGGGCGGGVGGSRQSGRVGRGRVGQGHGRPLGQMITSRVGRVQAGVPGGALRPLAYSTIHVDEQNASIVTIHGLSRDQHTAGTGAGTVRRWWANATVPTNIPRPGETARTRKDKGIPKRARRDAMPVFGDRKPVGTLNELVSGHCHVLHLNHQPHPEFPRS